MPGLFGSETLDTAIGLVLVYLVIALIVSIINEWIAQLTQLRATTLEDGLRNMLNDPQSADDKMKYLADTLLKHKLIAGLSPIKTRDAKRQLVLDNAPPNYIPPRVFALALLDLVFPAGPLPTSIVALQGAIAQISNEPVKSMLQHLLDETNGDIILMRQGLEQWFNETMQRVTGWYRRKMRYITLAVGLVLTVLVNADSVLVARSLWASPAARAAVTATAADVERALPTPTPGGTFQSQVDTIDKAVSGLDSSQLFLTWSTNPNDQRALPWVWAGDTHDPFGLVHWFSRVLGLALTVLAVSLGAPFWFDVLNKFMAFRGTGKPPTDSTTSGSPST